MSAPARRSSPLALVARRRRRAACRRTTSRAIIAAGDLPAELDRPRAATHHDRAELAGTTHRSTVYYLVQQDGRHAARAGRPRGGRRRAGPADRLGRAARSRPRAEEQAGGILTSIPADTVLLDTERRGRRRARASTCPRSLFDVAGRGAAQRLRPARLDGHRARAAVQPRPLPRRRRGVTACPTPTASSSPAPSSRSDYVALAPAPDAAHSKKTAATS